MEKRIFINEKKRIVTTVLTDEYGKYVGHAKCHPEDTFNEKFGKTISHKKAKLNSIKSYKTELNLRKRNYLEIIKKIDNEISQLDIKINKEGKKLTEYISKITK